MAKNGDIFYLWANSLRLTKPYDALMNWNVFFRDFYSSEQEVCFYSCLSVINIYDSMHIPYTMNP